MNSLTSTDSWQTLKYHFKAWRLLGIYSSNIDKNYFYYFYSVYGIALNFIVTILFPISFIIPTIQANNMEEFCENGFKSLADLICSMKLIQTWRVLDRLLALRPSMERLDQRLNSPAEHRSIHAARQFTWSIIKAIVGIFFCLWMSALPLAFLTGGRQLTFPGWFPWDWQSTQLRYVFTNCFQYACLTVQVVQDICSDSYPLALLSMIGAHIRALGIRVQNIGNNNEGDIKHRVRFGSEMLRIKGHQQIEAQRELNACIDDHNLVLTLLDTILETISTTCFFQFFCTALSVCFLCGYAMYAQLNFTAQVNIFFFFAVIVMETLLVCSSGELVYHECEQLTTAIYSCKWYNMDVKFQRTLLVMLHRSQKIKQLMAANFIPVRISTFVVVMKAAYSMFTLLNKMNSK